MLVKINIGTKQKTKQKVKRCGQSFKADFEEKSLTVIHLYQKLINKKENVICFSVLACANLDLACHNTILTF